jgi:hypothetical protein
MCNIPLMWILLGCTTLISSIFDEYDDMEYNISFVDYIFQKQLNMQKKKVISASDI